MSGWLPAASSEQDLQLPQASSPTGDLHSRLAIDAASEAEAIRTAVRGGWRVLAVDVSGAADSAAVARPGKQGLPLLQFSQERSAACTVAM